MVGAHAAPEAPGACCCPAARPTLMVGVNQVIMLALNMVIIASMIGAGGLGFDVLLGAARASSSAPGMEAGFAIVALAIVLDRLSQAVAVSGSSRSTSTGRRGSSGGAIRTLLGARSPDRRHDAELGLRSRRLQPIPEGIAPLDRRPVWKAPSTGSTSTSSTQHRSLHECLCSRRAQSRFKRLLRRAALAQRRRPAGVAGWRLGGWRLALLTGCADARSASPPPGSGKGDGHPLSLRHLGRSSRR